VAFQPNEVHTHHLLSHWPLHPPPGRQPYAHQPYPAARLDDPDDQLFVASSRGGKRTLVPRDRWKFARVENGQLIPDDRYVWLDGGFQPGTWYDVVFTTRICPVVGTGLLAIRDSTAWLRDGAD
jgi:hypothetical protein